MLADDEVIFNVVEQALTPGMALRACQLPESDTSSKLSRLINSAVAERAASEVAAERSIWHRRCFINGGYLKR